MYNNTTNLNGSPPKCTHTVYTISNHVLNGLDADLDIKTSEC